MRGIRTYIYAPRFASGLARRVSQAEAYDAAQIERQAHGAARAGFFGCQERRLAEAQGSCGTVYCHEAGTDHVFVLDLVTLQEFLIPNEEWRRLPWHDRTVADRQQYQRAQLVLAAG